MQFFKARQLDMHILQTLWHFQASFLASLSLTWNALPTKSKPPLSSCKVNSRDIRTQPFPTVPYSHLLTNGHSKGTRHGRKSYKGFSLNPLYQIGEDYWNISFSKSRGMNNPVIFSPQSAEPCQEHKMTRRCLAQTTCPQPILWLWRTPWTFKELAEGTGRDKTSSNMATLNFMGWMSWM